MTKTDPHQEVVFPYSYGLQILQGKWQPKLISTIYFYRQITYSDIRSYLSPISDTVLSVTLRKLIGEGIVKKILMPRAVRLEGYALTSKGRALVPVLHVLCRWSALYKTKKKENFMPLCIDCPIRRGLRDPLASADDYHHRCPAETVSD